MRTNYASGCDRGLWSGTWQEMSKCQSNSQQFYCNTTTSMREPRNRAIAWRSRRQRRKGTMNCLYLWRYGSLKQPICFFEVLYKFKKSLNISGIKLSTDLLTCKRLFPSLLSQMLFSYRRSIPGTHFITFISYLYLQLETSSRNPDKFWHCWKENLQDKV